MKKLLVAFVMALSFNVFANSETECWTDSSGHTHCTTYPSGDITPHGWE